MEVSAGGQAIALDSQVAMPDPDMMFIDDGTQTGFMDTELARRFDE